MPFIKLDQSKYHQNEYQKCFKMYVGLYMIFYRDHDANFPDLPHGWSVLLHHQPHPYGFLNNNFVKEFRKIFPLVTQWVQRKADT